MKTPLFAVTALTLAACGGSVISPELHNARQAYDRATRTRAAEYTPASVLSARQALDAAERAHDDDPGSDREKAHAYVAQRRAELAIVHGDIAYERAEKERAQARYAELQDELRSRTSEALAASEDRAASLNQALQRQSEQTVSAQSATERERQARLEAEARAQRALDSLQQIAQVKEEARGTVITLSGQVLFVTAKADLLPAARDALAAVAKALLDSGESQPITVEGHTDSRGNEEHNQLLSKQRADAVRDYLVGQGVKPERITTVGYGETRPVASNDTAEGRANNRRVEIVIGKRQPG
jgi:outer membrane protein OmpA-like peptidoglycan-associated protein